MALLEKFNKEFPMQYEDAVRKGTVIRKEEIKNPYQEFEEAKKKNKEFEVIFDFADGEGNLSFVNHNGVKIVLTKEEFRKANHYYTEEIKSRLLGIPIRVKVLNISKDDSIVYCTSAISRNEIKGSLISELYRSLDKGKPIEAWGIVLFVNQTRAVVNIFGRNVLGIIEVSEWSNAYIRYLNQQTSPGEPIRFMITGPAPRKKGKDYAFLCSRKLIAPDPWISLGDFHPGDVITVRCIDKPAGKSYFWGVSPHAPGIEIMCNLTENLNIMTTLSYKCKIKAFDREKKIFRVYPFALVTTGLASEKNIQFVNQKGKKRKVEE